MAFSQNAQDNPEIRNFLPLWKFLRIGKICMWQRPAVIWKSFLRSHFLGGGSVSPQIGSYLLALPDRFLLLSGNTRVLVRTGVFIFPTWEILCRGGASTRPTPQRGRKSWPPPPRRGVKNLSDAVGIGGPSGRPAPTFSIEHFPIIVGDGVLDVPPPQRGGKSRCCSASAGGALPRPYSLLRYTEKADPVWGRHFVILR